MKDLNEGDITYPFGVLNFPQNRHHKKAAEKEFANAFKLIYNVEVDFYKELFTGDSSYSDVYHKYLSKFDMACRLIKSDKPKYIELDPQYFALTFRPLEK